MKTRLLVTLLCVLLATAPLHGQALTISTPGPHVLTQHWSGPGPSVVQIDADNVQLDLNGFTIRCTQDPATGYCAGVAANGRTNVQVFDGTVTGGFFGVGASYSTGIVLRDLDLSGNTYIGANLGYGVNNVVQRVTCNHLGGYTVEAYAICINGIGDYGLVEDLAASELYRQAGASGVGEGVVLLVEQGAVGVVARRVTGTNATHQANTIGVWSANGGAVNLSDSAFTNFHTGVQGSGFTMTANQFTLAQPLAGAVGVSAPAVSLAGSTFTGYTSANAWLGGIADAGGNVIVGEEPPPPPPGGVKFRVCTFDANGVMTCYEGLLLPVSPGGW